MIGRSKRCKNILKTNLHALIVQINNNYKLKEINVSNSLLYTNMHIA